MSKTSHYKKLDSISHILVRPDMYIGTNQSQKQNILLYSNSFITYEQDLLLNDGILRCFTEALSNSIDNYFRSKNTDRPMTKLYIKYNSETQYIQIINDGNHIPIEIHPEEKIYIPEMIFGHLLSGSNYNDDENRISSGRNGLGVKLLNVFSQKFDIELYDIDKEVVYKQSWEENMRKAKKPKIKDKKKSAKDKTGYTKIGWTLDFSKFKNQDKMFMEQHGYDTILLEAFKKLAIDSSMIMGIPVYWNEEKFHVKKLVDYCGMFQFYDKKFCIEGTFPNSNLHFCILPFHSLSHISFVNGIFTKDGGYHVDLFYQKLFAHLLPRLKKYNITNKDLKKYFSIVLNIFVPNPEFSSQSKTKLISCKNDLSKLISFDEKVIQKLMKWEFVNQIKQEHELKQELSLKKTEKKRGFKKIDGYDAANLAGGKKSRECSLILCEGLSAKTFATKGITKGVRGRKGRDFFGIYPLRGKCLNVRNASATSIANNREIKDIIQCLNLKFGTDYTKESNFETLRYGEILILTDADVDGLHICGLLINIFSSLFPSLLKRETCFIKYMLTAVAKIKIKNETFVYYDDFSYQKKLKELEESNVPPRSFEIKYYKGLGTSNDSEIRDTFAEKVVHMNADEDSHENLNLVFHKSMTLQRKNWLLTNDETTYNTPGEFYNITEFLSQDFIKFSIDDCKRSIPSILDGLKPSQRKIIYSVFQKKLNYQAKSLKVAQLASYCAEVSLYHHGEQNLSETIVKLAHSFVGSNNINLLYSDGQFGSRLQNGKDAASSRYIYTKMEKLTDKIFAEDDYPLLKFSHDDGMKVEPVFYIPIIPMILINGTRAIGTGWSSFIPNFNLEDVIQKLYLLMENKLEEFESMQLIPFYHNFSGVIEKMELQKFSTKGILETKEIKNKIIYVVKEIPIGESIDAYKSFCEKLLEEKVISNFKNYSSAENVHFEFQKHDLYKKEFTMETLKLVSTLATSNMVLFTKDNKIKKYDSIDDIFYEFYDERLLYFEKRIKYMLDCLSTRQKFLTNKSRFILQVVHKEIELFNKNDKEISSQLEELEYEKENENYEYLLSMPIKSMTKDKYIKLKKEIDNIVQEMTELETTNAKELWKKELHVLQSEYLKFHGK